MPCVIDFNLTSPCPHSLSRFVSCLCPTYLYSGWRSYGHFSVTPFWLCLSARSGLTTPLSFYTYIITHSCEFVKCFFNFFFFFFFFFSLTWLSYQANDFVLCPMVIELCLEVQDNHFKFSHYFVPPSFLHSYYTTHFGSCQVFFNNFSKKLFYFFSNFFEKSLDKMPTDVL